MNNIFQFPIKFEHSAEHKIFHDQLIKILSDYNDVMIDDNSMPKYDQYNIDFRKITIAHFLNWTIREAQNLSHDHEKEI